MLGRCSLASTNRRRTSCLSTACTSRNLGAKKNRARNWQRYDLGGKTGLAFEEGVDSYVTFSSCRITSQEDLYKVKSTMCNCGVTTIPDLQKNAKLTLVSATSIVEGGYHDVTFRATNASNN